MPSKNTSCIECGKLFHTCGSCDLNEWEWHLCSLDCWKKYKKTTKNKLSLILNKLDEDDKKFLTSIAEYDFTNSIFEEILDEQS